MLRARVQMFGSTAEGRDGGGLSAGAITGWDERDWLLAAGSGHWLFFLISDTQGGLNTNALICRFLRLLVVMPFKMHLRSSSQSNLHTTR